MGKSMSSVKKILFTLFSAIMLIFLVGVGQTDAAAAIPDWVVDAYNSGLKLNGTDTNTGSFEVKNISPGYKDSFTITVNSHCTVDFLLNAEVKCLADSSTYAGDTIMDEIILARQLVVKTYLDGIEIPNFPNNSAAILKTGTVLPTSLGEYDIDEVNPGDVRVFKIEIELPGTTTGNEYQDKAATLQWLFTMELLGDDDDDPVPLLSKESDKEEVRVGDLVTYTIKAKNNGSEESVWAEVIITDALAAGLKYMGHVDGYGDIIEYDPEEHVVTVNFGDIAGGAEKEAKFKVEVTDAYAVGDLVENSVRSDADEYEVEDPNPPIVIGEDGDDDDDDDPIPDLAKESDKDEVRVGDLFTYTIKAANNGSEESVWEEVIITDALAAGLEYIRYVDGYGDIIEYDPDEHVVTINFGNIAGGEKKEAKFTVKVTNAYAVGDLVENSVRSDAGENEVEDPNPPIVIGDGIRITKRGADGIFYFRIEEQIEGVWTRLDMNLVPVDTRISPSPLIELPLGIYRVTEVNRDDSPMTYYTVNYSFANGIVNVVEEGVIYDITVTNIRNTGGGDRDRDTGSGGDRDRDSGSSGSTNPSVTPPTVIPEPPTTNIPDTTPPLAEQIPDAMPPLGVLPQTGDSGVPLLLYVLFALSCLGMGTALYFRKKAVQK